jgi:hypothetical protein
LTRATAEQDERLQRTGFDQYAGSDALFGYVCHGDIDGHGEERFGFATEGDEVEECPVGLEIDQEVEVSRAFGVREADPNP